MWNGCLALPNEAQLNILYCICDCLCVWVRIIMLHVDCNCKNRFVQSSDPPHRLNSESQLLINTDNTGFHITSHMCSWFLFIIQRQKSNVRNRVTLSVIYFMQWTNTDALEVMTYSTSCFLSSPLFPCSVHLNLCLS